MELLRLDILSQPQAMIPYGALSPGIFILDSEVMLPPAKQPIEDSHGLAPLSFDGIHLHTAINNTYGRQAESLEAMTVSNYL